ncbi:hypothetical protein AB0L53_34075 [Nonomuraea sp. NPDC052129]|uniref:hypothetical protein n=1 Tax=Nonomuraea sp. NPDC052129 TaxID=3154651 RepID=UPI003424E525
MIMRTSAMAVAGMVIVAVAVAISAVVLVLSAPAGRAVPSAPAASQQVTDEDPEDGERVAPGTAWSLQLDGETRQSLVDVTPTAGARAALSGSVYFGAVYGQSEAEDDYYAIAMTDRIHFWSKHGGEAWRYRGDFEKAGCIAPVPSRLYTAWGLSLSTARPDGRPPCPH